MINVPLFRFQQGLGRFILLLVQGCSEAVLFWYLSNDVFESPQFRKYISYECHINSVWASLSSSISKGTLKLYFYDIYLTTFLEVCNFGNTLAMSVIFFFLTMLKI